MVGVSRFGAMTPEQRRADPAYSGYVDDCEHPEDARTAHDSGGVTCSPTYYCTACERRVYCGAGSEGSP